MWVEKYYFQLITMPNESAKDIFRTSHKRFLKRSLNENIFRSSLSHSNSSLLHSIVHYFSFLSNLQIFQTILEANQNKNNCLVSNFLDKLKSPALFSHLFRTEKSAGNFNLSKKLLTRQLFLFWFASSTIRKDSFEFLIQGRDDCERTSLKQLKRYIL